MQPKTVKPLMLCAAGLFVFVNTVYTQNYFAGSGAGAGNTGTAVTAVGAQALASGNSGVSIAAFGYNALNKNTSGYSNTAVGATALFSNTTGHENTAGGNAALYLNTTGYYNCAYGVNSLFFNTSGYQNSALGYSSLASNTTGFGNVALGSFTLHKNTTGQLNTAVGLSALQKNTTGRLNTGIGYYALSSNTTGLANCAIGFQPLAGNTTGSNNVAIGRSALYYNTGGSDNVGIGTGTLFQNQTGSFNVVIGDGAAYNRTQYEKSVFIGSNAEAANATLINAIAIGYNSIVDASNKAVIGNTSMLSIGGQVGWTTFSDQRLKKNISTSKLGLDFIRLLNPVTYNYLAEGQANRSYTGLIAQEVDEAARKAGENTFSAIDKNGTYWGIRYAELTVPVIKAIQELDSETKKEIAALKAENELLKERLLALEEKITALPKNSNAGKTSSQLFQNTPNPFSAVTYIRYQLDNDTQNGWLRISSIDGKILKQVTITNSGKGQLTINAGELAPGTYSYTLYADGKIVDTKLMVLTH